MPVTSSTTEVQSGSSAQQSQSAADSLLPIVQSQRERFRSRVQELEAVGASFPLSFERDVSCFVVVVAIAWSAAAVADASERD